MKTSINELVEKKMGFRNQVKQDNIKAVVEEFTAQIEVM